MTSVSFTSGGPGAPALQGDLEAVGLRVTGALALRTMVQEVIRTAPDVIVCHGSHPDDALFAVTSTLQGTAPRPFVLFTADPDVEKIERAAASGVHAYVIGGYGADRLRSVIHVVQARLRREQTMRDELSDVHDRFTERKLVDHAKGIPMRVRYAPEEEALEVLRSAAMQSKRRDFVEGVAFLEAAPLSTGESRSALAAAAEEWRDFRRAVESAETAGEEMASPSEAPLARFGQLTDLHEQGIRSPME